MKAGGFAVFMSMGGYAFYVWTSYAVVAVAIVVEIVAARARLRRSIRAVAASDRTTVAAR